MGEKIGQPTGQIGSGSTLLLIDETPITAAEGFRDCGPIETYNIMMLGLDILADRDCTVQIIRLPDGVYEGEASIVAAVSANTPAHHIYSQVMAPRMLVRVVNTSGADMASFSLRVRGGA